jgi:hypothetical protein
VTALDVEAVVLGAKKEHQELGRTEAPEEPAEASSRACAEDWESLEKEIEEVAR